MTSSASAAVYAYYQPTNVAHIVAPTEQLFVRSCLARVTAQPQAASMITVTAREKISTHALKFNHSELTRMHAHTHAHIQIHAHTYMHSRFHHMMMQALLGITAADHLGRKRTRNTEPPTDTRCTFT
eukprot:m.228939 g.228939  ORF g.228939 m.228939 type:complete len:127 (+) comp19250_c1_seq55:3124-3504(+)